MESLRPLIIDAYGTANIASHEWYANYIQEAYKIDIGTLFIEERGQYLSLNAPHPFFSDGGPARSPIGFRSSMQFPLGQQSNCIPTVVTKGGLFPYEGVEIPETTLARVRNGEVLFLLSNLAADMQYVSTLELQQLVYGQLGEPAMAAFPLQSITVETIAGIDPMEFIRRNYLKDQQNQIIQIYNRAQLFKFLETGVLPNSADTIVDTFPDGYELGQLQMLMMYPDIRINELISQLFFDDTAIQNDPLHRNLRNKRSGIMILGPDLLARGADSVDSVYRRMQEVLQMAWGVDIDLPDYQITEANHHLAWNIMQESLATNRNTLLPQFASAISHTVAVAHLNGFLFNTTNKIEGSAVTSRNIAMPWLVGNRMQVTINDLITLRDLRSDSDEGFLHNKSLFYADLVRDLKELFVSFGILTRFMGTDFDANEMIDQIRQEYNVIAGRLKDASPIKNLVLSAFEDPILISHCQKIWPRL